MSARIPLLLAATIAIGAVLAPSSASACRRPPGSVPPPNETGLHWGISITTVATVDAVVIAGQIGLHAQLFPDALAVPELVLGIAETAGAIAIFASAIGAGFSSCDTDPWPNYGVPSSIALAAVGGWLVAHAIWSLVVLDPAPEVTPTVAVSPEGATLAVIGTF